MIDPVSGSAHDWLEFLAVAAAGIAGAGYLLRRIHRTVTRSVRAIKAIEHVVTNELTHNHGSSMKDDVFGIALAVGELGRNLDALQDRVKLLEDGQTTLIAKAPTEGIRYD